MSHKTIKEAMDHMNIPRDIRSVIFRCYYYRYRASRLDDSFDKFIANLRKPFDHRNDLFHARGIGPTTFRKLREAFLGDQEVQDGLSQAQQE